MLGTQPLATNANYCRALARDPCQLIPLKTDQAANFASSCQLVSFGKEGLDEDTRRKCFYTELKLRH